MKHGFLKVASVTPKIKVADPKYNSKVIIEQINAMSDKGVKLMVFPELCITGYTCGDLFLQELLLDEAKNALEEIVKASKNVDAIIFVGMPIERDGSLYNVAAVVNHGILLGIVPKYYIPAYGEFCETRYFAKGNTKPCDFRFVSKGMDVTVPFGTNIVFTNDKITGLCVACEICEDIWAADTPSIEHAAAGATVIVNLSASNETVGKDEYREMLVKSMSARLISGYVYASCGEGESTQDLVFGGHNLIGELGTILKQSKRFECESIVTDLDIHKIRMERRRVNTFTISSNENYVKVPFELECDEARLDRTFEKMPFVPEDVKVLNKRCDEILSIQSYGLKKRLEHIGCKKAIIGVSGGLDSTLALLITARTFDMLNIPRENIMAVTMPCFGTTDRTYDNACRMTHILSATLEEIDIKEAVTVHFKDIKQSADNHDVTYENSQARERTQILMDIANRENGIVVGTGDLSELALGWATYNGDHMSMYGVNAGVPKTLIRHLVRYYADTCNDDKLSGVLLDVLDTPVSPELLPPVDGNIAQKTEDLVGPYELHDFFLYYMLRFGFEPAKIYRIAKDTFEGIYECDTILKWLKTFYRRFFTQQFKRSCLPDGPKVGSVGLSPRGDLHMPSDACATIWLEQIDKM